MNPDNTPEIKGRVLARVLASDLADVSGGLPAGQTVSVTCWPSDPTSVDITNVDGDSD